MASGRKIIADSKPAGIKRKHLASALRESSQERHRQSYIRAWHAINQAKEDAAVGLKTCSQQSEGEHKVATPQNEPQLLWSQRSRPQAAAEGLREVRNAQETQPNVSYVKTSERSSNAANIPATPWPSKADGPRTPSDDGFSEASGEGPFVTPNVDTASQNVGSIDVFFRAAAHDARLARLVPFPTTRSKRDLALIFDAPDSPRVDGISKATLKTAAREVFGSKAVRKVYQSSPGVWLIRLLSRQDARDGAGKKLSIGGVDVVAEKIPKDSSKVFVWRSEEADAAPSSKEIADKVRQTFGWPLPDVKVEHTPRKVTLAFQKCPELLRFYLRLDSGVEARFDPVLR